MSLFVVLSSSNSCPSSSWMRVKCTKLAAGGLSGCSLWQSAQACVTVGASPRSYTQNIGISGKVRLPVPSHVIHGEDITRLVLKSISISVASFPGASEGKVAACNAGDLGPIPGSGRSTGEGNGDPLWYSCLENPHGRKSLVQAIVNGVAKSQT